jgi:hypothetical protein
MKTAMQELMESFDDYQHESHEDSITIEKLKEVISDKFIELEKQQLIYFHTNTMKIGLIEEGKRKWCDAYEPKIKEVAENYYNETFEKQ